VADRPPLDRPVRPNRPQWPVSPDPTARPAPDWNGERSGTRGERLVSDVEVTDPAPVATEEIP
jgi:hypothetical protein